MILASKIVLSIVFVLLAVFFLYLLHRDRTMHLREQKLKEEEERFHAITDSARDAIIVMDAKGKISYWNPAAEELTGYSRKEAIGRGLHDLIAPKRYHPAREAAFPRFAETGEGAAMGKTRELELLHKSGEEIPVELSLAATKAADGWNAIGILRDLSDRKESEKKLREAKEEAEELNAHLETQTAIARDMAAEADMANAAKTMFLTNMGHELRTPLNGVLGMAELLLHSDLGEQERSYAEAVRKSGEQLLTLLNDLIDFSNIESGRLELNKVPFDIHPLLSELCSSIQERAEDKGLVFTSSIPPSVPTPLYEDPKRLRQVLFNLLDNAVKFTPQGSVSFSVHTIGEENGNIRIQFTVGDTGIGIPPDQRETLFEGFTQVDGSSTRKYGGTGLGLSISKRLIDMMGGEIEVGSEEGKGTEFRVFLGFEHSFEQE